MDPDRNASSTEEDALESGQGWLGFFDTSPACTLVYQVCCVVCALSLYILFLPSVVVSMASPGQEDDMVRTPSAVRRSIRLPPPVRLSRMEVRRG